LADAGRCVIADERISRVTQPPISKIAGERFWIRFHLYISFAGLDRRQAGTAARCRSDVTASRASELSRAVELRADSERVREERTREIVILPLPRSRTQVRNVAKTRVESTFVPSRTPYRKTAGPEDIKRTARIGPPRGFGL
jgi:hypothetical protein